jgi:hypothetical protein
VDLRALVVATLIAIVVLNSPRISASESQLSVQVGARGDDASAGNLGVRAKIQTHLYSADPGVLDYFWVGTILSDGAFVQFGYALEPGQFCLKGAFLNGEFKCDGASVLLSASDGRWQWQYWPDAHGNDFYYEIGPAVSAGLNGTWHEYSVVPSSNQTIRFAVDQEQVAYANFRLESSKEPLMAVAEKVAHSSQLGSLGPVEFRDLEYLQEDGWHPVDSIVSLSSCGFDVSCNYANSYGVTLVQPNQIVAGSGGEIHASEQLLWTSSYVTLNVTVHSGLPFHVSTVTGDHVFVATAYASVPKGMFADIWLTETRTRTNSLLGLIGAVDEFQGWIGDESSRNATIRILMNRNASLQASWHTDLFPALENLTILAVFSATLVILVSMSRRRHDNMRRPLRT